MQKNGSGMDAGSVDGARQDGPLFSVVIPVYNAASFLEVTLKSVYAQTCPDFEIVAVNDGSQDDSLSILHAQTDTRLRVIDQENGGECAARNRGIREARGKYIAFLDSDDAWRADHLALAAEFFRRRPDIVWYSTRYERVEEIGDAALQSVSGEGDPGFMLVEWFLEGDDWTSSSSTVVLRKALPQLDLFPVGVPMFGDFIGWCRMAMKYSLMGVCSRRTALYRQVDTSACAVYNSRFACVRTLEATGVKRVMEEMIKMLEDPACSPEARRFLRVGFIPEWNRHATVDMYQGLRQEMDSLGWPLPFLARCLLRTYLQAQVFSCQLLRRLLSRIYRIRSRRLVRHAQKKRIPC